MIYFDNAATSYPKPEVVYTYSDYFFRDYGVNVGRGQYSASATAKKLVDDTRDLLKELFNCSNYKDIVFTPSATIALNMVIKGLTFEEGDVIYITPFEHNAVYRVLMALQKEKKVIIQELDVDKETYTYDLEKIAYQFQEQRPNAIIMTHASNVCGLITPISEIALLGKKYGAVTVADMAQTAGLLDIDFKTNQIDYGIFAGHKTLYASFGIAGIIMDKNSKLVPLFYGGTGIDSINPNMPEKGPERFEAGSLNIQAISSLYAALKWHKEIGTLNIQDTEKNHLRRLIECIQCYPFIHLKGYKDLESNIGVVSCVFDGYSSDEVGRILDEHDIAVRTGLHCAPRAHYFLDTIPSGTVRFSVGYFNQKTDFDILGSVFDLIEENS